MIKVLLEKRTFQVGLLIKLFAIFILMPVTQAEWFVPFVQQSILHPSLDPWQTFLNRGGNPQAFPYGIVMLLFHMPFVMIGTALDSLLNNTFYFSQLTFSLSLLAADIGLLWILIKMEPDRLRAMLWCYWLSPIVFFITYWHGQTDIIPILLMTSSLYAIRQGRLSYSGLLLALSIAAKISCAILAPFVLLFLYKNQRYAHQLPKFSIAFAAVLLLAQGIFLLSPGVQIMMLANPEMSKVYEWSLQLPGGSPIYIIPILYAFLLYAAWEFGRMNLATLQAFLGMAFLLIILFTRAPVGWYLWIVPFLVLYQVQADTFKQIVIISFHVLFLMYYSFEATGAYSILWDRGWNPTLLPIGYDLLLSSLVALGILIGMNMMLSALKNRPKWRYPLSIGIAGDSGTGKDTLSLALAKLFGEYRVASLSGDDYHCFERQHGLWKMITHLNPKANALHQFAEHATSLLKGQAIRCRHYSHQSGRFHIAKEIKTNDIILISGLHTLYMEHLANRFDVKIFLSMEESLRRHFKLKRDVAERGHSQEAVLMHMDSRMADAEKYISPQADKADIHFSLQSLQPVDADSTKLSLSLQARLPATFPLERFIRLALSVGNLQVHECAPHCLQLEGNGILAQDIQAMARTLIVEQEEFMAIEPQWSEGILGLMQLIVFVQLTEGISYAH